MSDESAPETAPATAGDLVADAVAAVAQPIARLIGRRGPCPACDRRKTRIKQIVDGAVSKIRIGRRPK